MNEFDKWMIKEYGEEADWDEGWTRGDMREAFKAGIKSRNGRD